MANPRPPRPPSRAELPPPPGRAQRLVARSGFVVYEDGSTLFDQPLLVFAARHRREWPDFDIQDHVGRHLGRARSLRRPPFAGKSWPVAVLDPGGNEILRVSPRSRVLKPAFRITGVTSTEMVGPATSWGELQIGAGVEPFGFVTGSGLRALSAQHLSVLDHDRRRVATIRRFANGGFLSTVDDYVVSFDPTLRGELRRLLIAVPTVIAFIRRAQQSS